MWTSYIETAVLPIRPATPIESNILRGRLKCPSASLKLGLDGQGDDGLRGPKWWTEPVDDGDVTPNACVVIGLSDAEDDSGDDGRSKFVGRLSYGGIRDDDSGSKSPVAPLPKPDAPDACVMIRSSAVEGDSGDSRYNHAHLSVGLSCGGTRGDDSASRSPVAPLPEPDAPDACVVMRLSAAGDESGGSGHNNHAHLDISVGRSPCGGIGGDDSGGKPPVSPPSEPRTRFSDAALATSRYLCRTAAGAAIATFATEKVRRIRTNVLSGRIFVDVTVMTL